MVLQLSEMTAPTISPERLAANQALPADPTGGSTSANMIDA